MKDLRIKYNELESELATAYSTMLCANEEILIGGEDLFERRNYVNGKVIEIFILKVSGDGIYTIDSQDNNTKTVIRFSDLASIEDRLNLLGLMENKLQIK